MRATQPASVHPQWPELHHTATPGCKGGQQMESLLFCVCMWVVVLMSFNTFFITRRDEKNSYYRKLELSAL